MWENLIGFVPNLFHTAYSSKALLCYLTYPFVFPFRSRTYYSHSNFQEAEVIAGLLHENGYQVDILQYNSPVNYATYDYDLVLGLEPYVFSTRLRPGGIRIYYATGSYWRFQNLAENKRLREIYLRRGVRLLPRQQVSLIPSLKTVDGIILIGNSQTLSTYPKLLQPKIKRVTISAYEIYTWPQLCSHKNFSECRQHFLWFGSSGATHKGLGQLLEIFSRLPNLHLHIAGNVANEPDFTRAFHRELSLPNIHLHGWMDIRSREYLKLITTCAFTVLPSCSESINGAVATNMHSGLIPLVTPQCGISPRNCGFLISPDNNQSLQHLITRVSRLTPSELRNLAQASFDQASRMYTLQKFRSDYHTALKSFIPSGNQIKL